MGWPAVGARWKPWNLRRHGPWEPHRLPLEEMEYTTMPAVAKKLSGRWQPVE